METAGWLQDEAYGDCWLATGYRTRPMETAGWLLATHKVDGAEAAMANLTEVGVELLGVLFEKQLGDVGVLEAPRTGALVHAGTGGGGGAAAQPPATIWVCDCDATAPTDGSSAGQRLHTDPHLREQHRERHTERRCAC